MTDRRLFDASPNPYLLLDRRLHIADANRAYLDTVRRDLDDLVGRWAWDAFPGEPDTVRQVIASCERVIRTGQPDTMALLHFAIPRPAAEGGGFMDRYWSLTHAPVLDAAGAVEFVLQHPIDVTELQHLQAAIEQSGLSSALQVSPAQSGIFQRAQSVYDSNLTLRAQSERLTEMFAQAPGFMALLRGPEHRFELANQSYMQLIGHRPVLGRTVAEALPDAAAQGYVALLDQVFRSGEAHAASGARFAVQAVPGGPEDERFIDFVCQPIRDEAGQVTGLFVEGSDVTARKAGEAALADSEARYRTLFETIETGFCIIELRFDGAGRAVDYRIVEANPAFERLTGQHGVTGRWVSDFAPELERHWFDTYGAVALTGEPRRFENAARAFGRWYDVQALRIGDPAAHRVAVLFNDISERRRAEEALLDLTASLEAQVEERTRDRDRMWRLSTDIMLVAGFDGHIMAVNPAWEAVLGWTTAGLVGRSFLELVHPDDLQGTLDAAAQLRGGETVRRFENRYRHSNGTYRWITWAAVPGDGLINAVGRDVQQDKERAEALRRSEEALRQSQKMEAVGQLTGGLAHDFNNLLTAVTGSLELLQSRIAQGRFDELDRFVAAAQNGAARAAALTHRLLAFSRRQTLDPRPTDVNRLVRGMEELVRRTVGPEIAVSLQAADDLWNTLVDPGQLENALLNLCINARDAMPGGGRITVETGNLWLDERAARERDLPPGPYVSLCVADTGAGMAPDVIAKAFDPFFTTKPIGQGTGLGLSMIYGFARQSGGQVRIRSRPGEGARVCLCLPRYVGEAGSPPPRPELADAPRADTGETVLVVDDEPAVRMLVAEVLQELGYAALEAADGAAGLALLQSPARVDLLVSDVGLPGGMNGRQLADAARLLRPGLRVLFITGYAEAAVLGEGQLEPGMHVMTKPFAMQALASRIKALIAGGGAAQPARPISR
ncbi:PAS domain-containing protein [Roseomonas haemaphysalidis]|nr:PAS domain-containing protein [Roseomonas haemaphysalidis]